MEEVGKWADSFIDYLYENKKPVPFEQQYPKQNFGALLARMQYVGPWTMVGYGVGRSKGLNDGGMTMENIDGKYYVPKWVETQNFAPGIHNVITDWSNAPSESITKLCSGLELRALECVEYYGRQRGYVICKDFYDDLVECKFQRVQRARWSAMRNEYKKRMWKQLRGELPADQVGENGMVTKPMLPCWASKDPLRTDKTSPIIDNLDD